MSSSPSSYYRRLGIARSASTEEIRVAYRELARRLHPDHQTGASAAERALAERRIREINEAWQTLRDPTTRRAYDERRRTTAPSHPSTTPDASPVPRDGAADDDDLVDVMGHLGPMQAQVVRGLPWAVLLAVFAAIFVFTAYATVKHPSGSPARTRSPATVSDGSCLRIRTGPTPPATAVVGCEEPHDGRLMARVAEGTACPPGSERRRLATDGLLDCVAP